METGWPTLEPQSTVEDAIRLFAESRVSGAPVVEDERLVGIITEGDLIFQDAEEYRREAIKSAGVIVGDVMTTAPDTIFPEATLVEAATIMAERRRKILPVVDGERLVGVITRMDILTLHLLKPRH